MRIGIIGAGITGSYLGGKLAEQGHEVMIFEKNRTIGKTTCSGLVSGRIWDYIPRKKTFIENKISHADIHFPSKTARVNFRPRMYVMSRPKLDRYFAKKAEESGARIFKSHELKRLFHFKGHKPQISICKRKKSLVFEFDYLIGCDGPLSTVRNQLELKDPKLRSAIMVYKNKKSKANSVEIWPTENGFKWIIPRGKKFEYGVVENSSNAKKEFRKFCKKNRVSMKKMMASLIPQGLIVSGEPTVALCGDAAGLTKPWSGGGIIWGLKAADILVKNFPNINRYNRRIERFFTPKIFYSKIAEKLVKFSGEKMPYLLPKESTIDSDWVF